MQIRLDGRERPGLVVVSVEAGVQEHVGVAQGPEDGDGITGTAVDDTRPGFPDEISGFWIDVDRGEAAVSVSEQGGGNDAGPKTKVSARLDDVIRLCGTDNRVPPGPSRPVRLRRADPPEGIGSQPPAQMLGEVAVVLQVLRPGSCLPELASGDSASEPA